MKIRLGYDDCAYVGLKLTAIIAITVFCIITHKIIMTLAFIMLLLVVIPCFGLLAL